MKERKVHHGWVPLSTHTKTPKAVLFLQENCKKDACLHGKVRMEPQGYAHHRSTTRVITMSVLVTFPTQARCYDDTSAENINMLQPNKQEHVIIFA